MTNKHASRCTRTLVLGSVVSLLACSAKSSPSGSSTTEPPGTVTATDPTSPSSADPTGASPELPPATVVEPCVAIPSKTARAPKLLWSCERAATLEKLRSTNHPQWQELVSWADRTGTSTQRYGDNGGFAALVYQATGDVAYAKKAYAAAMIELNANKTFNYNYTRYGWTEYAILYDYLQGALTEEERQAMAGVLYGWVDQFFALDPVAPIRTADSDQTVGNYFGIMFTALATQGSDPRAEALLTNSFVGGYDATATNLATMRNAIKKYITEWAVGGVWVESGFYDIETLQLLAQGVEAMRNATGAEHFPEYAPFAEQVVRAQIAQLTPDLKGAGQWGDTEGARDLMAWRRYQTLGMYTGSLPLDSPMRPYGTAMTKDLKALSEGGPVYTSRFYFFFDPTAPTADWRTLPLSHYGSGQGILFAHDGWGEKDSLLMMQLRRPPMNIDHENAQFGNFELYRKGGWALTRPIGYGGGSIEPVSINSMVLAGLDSMIDRAIIGQSAAVDGSYVYFAGGAKGARYSDPYYDPPPAFVSEWSRSFLYLPTTNRSADTIVVYDRVDAVAPTRPERYLPDDQRRMQAAPKLKQWILHTPVVPTQSGTGATWTAASQQVALTSLAPAQRDVAVVDEKTLGWPANFPTDAEKHFYMSVSPKVDQPFDTFLNVLQVSDAGVAKAPTRVASTDNGMEGALVTRPGQDDTVALFSATRGTRLRSTDFSVSVEVSTGGLELFVADLDPTKKWKVGDSDLPIDAGGLAHLRIAVGGGQTLSVTAR